jgi:hypothetical protein
MACFVLVKLYRLILQASVLSYFDLPKLAIPNTLSNGARAGAFSVPVDPTVAYAMIFGSTNRSLTLMIHLQLNASSTQGKSA